MDLRGMSSPNSEGEERAKNFFEAASHALTLLCYVWKESRGIEEVSCRLWELC